MEFNEDGIEKPDQNTFDFLMKELRQRVKANDFVVTPRTDDAFLSKFLRTKNYIVEDAFRSIKRYYANVVRNLDFIKDVRPSQFESCFHKGPLYLFKNRLNGRRVGSCHAGRWSPKEQPLRDLQLASVLLVENVINEVETQENGVVIIFDMKGLSFEHVRQLTPRELKRILLTGQEGLPLRISEVHIVNPPPLYWTLYHISMRFVKEKIRKRTHLHNDIKSLHKYIDINICPKSLGGTLDDEEAQDLEFVDEVLGKDVLYETMWNGGKTHNKRKLNRKRSSNGDIRFAQLSLERLG